MPNYESAAHDLRENLTLLTNELRYVEPQNQVMWNLSNALLECVSALKQIDERLQNLEQKTPR